MDDLCNSDDIWDESEVGVELNCNQVLPEDLVEILNQTELINAEHEERTSITEGLPELFSPSPELSPMIFNPSEATTDVTIDSNSNTNANTNILPPVTESKAPASPSLLSSQLSYFLTYQGSRTKYLDVKEYFTLSQKEAAKTIGLSASTFNKKWRTASGGRKWPQRIIGKADREITCLLRNGNSLKGEALIELERLLRMRKEESRSVFIPLR